MVYKRWVRRGSLKGGRLKNSTYRKAKSKRTKKCRKGTTAKKAKSGPRLGKTNECLMLCRGKKGNVGGGGKTRKSYSLRER